MAESEALPDELRRRLDAENLRPIVEYVGDRLGMIDGMTRLEVVFDSGRLRKGWVHRGPMGVVELESLAAREARPLSRAAG